MPTYRVWIERSIRADRPSKAVQKFAEQIERMPVSEIEDEAEVDEFE